MYYSIKTLLIKNNDKTPIIKLFETVNKYLDNLAKRWLNLKTKNMKSKIDKYS